MSIIAMSLSYIMGYMWLKWRISLKIASCLILMIFYFSSVFYFMPQIINRNLFFKHIIYIQNGKIDDFESYLETCREKKNSAIRYYDNNGILSSNLKLKGYPFGMVIDKAGKIRQTENGFGPEVADLFLDKEIPLIKVLLNEN